MSSRCGLAPLQSQHGCGLKVVWKHHPPADPMKVHQDGARSLCHGFRSAWAAGKQDSFQALLIQRRGEGYLPPVCACVTYLACKKYTLLMLCIKSEDATKLLKNQ
ncbi:hypothetical protein CHARACLAT_005754 [Characodon lateralis]|uniref:Uncharacterized protein n=1 Tax=Characodon lateralis TaxID=208331 RepID=A0ABU7DEJ7_9TELE|nr:hypothetical protein [Characodon lateralis]